MSKLSNDIKLLLEAAAKPEMVKAAEASVEVEQYEPTDTGAPYVSLLLICANKILRLAMTTLGVFWET